MALSWTWSRLRSETPLGELVSVLNLALPVLARTLAERLEGTNTFPDGATTPNVFGASLWVVANTAPTSITALVGGVIAREIVLWSTTANTTLVHSAALYLKGGVNVVMAANGTRTFVTLDGANWRET